MHFFLNIARRLNFRVYKDDRFLRLIILQMQNFKLLLLGVAVLGFTSCSNDDSVKEETLNPNITGLSVETSSGSSLSDRVLNFKSPGTRAVNYTTLSLGLITDMPSVPSVPNDAADFTKVVKSWGAVDTDSKSVYLASGKTYSGQLGLGDKTYYISGDMTLTNVWGSGTIYILKGGSLNLNHSEGTLFNNGGVTVYNYGTLTTTASKFYIGGNEILYNAGNLDIPTQTFKCEGKVYVGGYLNTKGWESNQNERVNVVGNVTVADAASQLDGNIHVGGSFTAPAITLQNSCKFVSDCSIKTSGELRLNSNNVVLYANYVECASLYQTAASTIQLENGAYINCAGTYTNLNNGNDAKFVLEGDKAIAVVKAAKMIWNAGGDVQRVYLFQTPGSGSTIAVDCASFARLVNNNDEIAMAFNEFSFDGGTVVNIHDEDNIPANIKIAKTDCSPGYNPDPSIPTTDPTSPTIDVIAEVNNDHTHDVSATCVKAYNGNVYVSYHQRGTGQSGCLEVLNTTNNKTQLLQFVRDHNNELDYNSLTINPNGGKFGRIYAAGNSKKKGGMIAYIDLTHDGLMNTKDSVTEMGTAKPLNIFSLKGSKKYAAIDNDTTVDGDGNCVAVNGSHIEVMTTSGYRVYDAATLVPESVTKLPGKAKFIDINGNTMVTAYLAKAAQNADEAIKANIQTYATSDYKLATPLTEITNAADIQPNNGKNVVLIDGSKLYLCTGRDGLKVFENGTLSWSYQPEKITTSKGVYKAYCNGAAFDSKYIYLAYGSYGLIILDKTSHKVVAQRKMVKSANYVTLADGYIYVAYGRDCLQVFKLVE